MATPRTRNGSDTWTDAVKILLPLAVTAVGLYVSLVVAPLDARISREEKMLQDTYTLVTQHQASTQDILRRILQIESSLAAHRVNDHSSYALKEDMLRELSTFRESLMQVDGRLRDMAQDHQYYNERNTPRRTQ
jgi:hypothetical protein